MQMTATNAYVITDALITSRLDDDDDAIGNDWRCRRCRHGR